MNDALGTDDPYLQAIVGAALFGEAPEAAKIGRFSLLDRIGSGGMGTVYAAFDAKLDRKVAVKLLHNEGQRETHRSRIVREAQAMAKLSHPNVAQICRLRARGRADRAQTRRFRTLEARGLHALKTSGAVLDEGRGRRAAEDDAGVVTWPKHDAGSEEQLANAAVSRIQV